MARTAIALLLASRAAALVPFLRSAAVATPKTVTQVSYLSEVEDADVMKHYRETVIEMKTPVWLVVDYVTARVDEQGRTHFFADIYRKDSETIASR